MFTYINTQFKIAYKLFQNKNNIDIVIFFIGGDTLIVPMLLTKLLRKKSIIIIAGSSTETLKSFKDYLYIILKVPEFFTRYLSNKIIVYSPNLINTLKLNKYKNKIIIANHHYVDKNFKLIIPYNKRPLKISYIGRFSKEKGVIEFLHSIPYIVRRNPNIIINFIGDGDLREYMMNFIKIKYLSNQVRFPGWIEHKDLPKFINENKLIILPSYTEGLPNIMIESMACGTPVVATRVGGVSDIIKNNINGYYLKMLNPKDIAEQIHNALSDPNLNEVSKNSETMIKKEFSYSNVREKYNNIINEW